MNIDKSITNGCDEMSRVYSDMFSYLQDVMQDEEKLKGLSPLDFSALGIYIGKFVEQEINSSVVQLMRAFCGIEMPEYYCKRDPYIEKDNTDIKHGRQTTNINETKIFQDPSSLKPIMLGDAYYSFLQLKEEDEDGFFKDYSWLDKNFLEAWRNIFRLRNKMAHIGEIVDENMMKKLISFFQRFLSYMPKILELKKDLSPEGYYDTLPETTEKEEKKPYWVSTDNRDKPYAPLEVAKRFCELRDWSYESEGYLDKMEEKNAIADKYYLDAKIFVGANGKKGLMDCLGQLLVPANYDGFYFLPRTLEFDTESVIAIRNGKYVVTTLDGSGKELTSREYDEIKLARNDHPNLSYIYRKDGALSWGFMTKKGIELTECIIDSYSLGLNSFLFESGDKMGYWQFGFDVLPPIYDNIEMIDEPDDPLLFTLNGVPGYVHHDGSFISLTEYEEEGDDSEWDYFRECYL